MKLQAGQQAPQFRLMDVFGRTIDLDELRDKKVLIAFFRHAGCPFCNLRVHALTKIHEEVKSRGMEMIFFFESKGTVILRSTFHKEVSPIPLISDPGKTWYEKYGLEESFSGSVKSHLTSFVPTLINAKKAGVPVHVQADGESFNTMPAEFLIDHGRVIRKVLYSRTLNERLDLQEIIGFSKTPA